MKNIYTKKNHGIRFGLHKKILGFVSYFLLTFLFLTGQAFEAKGQTVQIGSGSGGTSSYIPFYYLYEKGYSQTIYTYDELTQAGMNPAASGLITTVRYLPDASVSTSNWEDWTIFMGNTVQDDFSNNMDWIDVSQMIQVFDGQIPSVTVSGQWLEITLDTPFQWDGTSNIVVAVNQTTPAWGTTPNWVGYTLAPASGGNKGIYDYQDGVSFDPANPPSGATTNTVAQIQFDGNLMSPCSGVPNAGVVADTILVCVGQPITLTTTGSDTGMSGLSGQWQSRDAGSSNAWQDIAGATSATYTISSAPATAQEYRYVLSCGSDDGFSNVMVGVIQPVNQCYCVPVGTNSSYYIDDFSTTGGTQNISNLGSGFSPNGFGDFTSMTLEQMQLGVVSFTTNIGSGSNTFGFRVWVDWDQDGVFDPVTEVVYQSSSYSASHSGSFTVPLTALAGSTKMRIASHYLSSVGNVDPCETNHTYGEFEDYTFIVAPLPPCSGMPDAGIVQGDTLFGACLNEAISLSVLGTDLADSMTYQWQQRVPAGTGSWADISGANGFTLNMPNGITDTTEIRFAVTCNTTGDIAYSNVITITLNDYNDCYCEPIYSSGCTSGDRISGFELHGDNGTFIINNGSDCSPGGYGDFTHLPAVDLYIDSTYTGTVTTDYSSPSSESVQIWIDFDNSGTFDSNELIASISGMSSGGDNFTFTVPPAYLGLHRMRVRLVYTTNASNIDPCNSASWGETEDYMVNIQSDATCLGAVGFQADEVYSDSVLLSWGFITPTSSWDIEYGPSGFTQGTGTVISGVTSSPYMVTGLLSDTEYDFYILSDCGSGDLSSWIGPVTERTECAPIAAMGYCEDFEDIDQLGCWYIINNNLDGENWSIYTSSDGIANSGNWAAGIRTDNLSNDDYLVLPQMTLTGNEVLTFHYRVWESTSPEAFQIVVSTGDMNVSSFTNVVFQDTVYNEEYKDTLVDLSAFTGNVWIAFRIPPTAPGGFYLFIDDICIDICNLTQGTNGSLDVCRTENVVNLDSVITSDYSLGNWTFPANQGAVSGSNLNLSTLASGTYDLYYLMETPCMVDTTVATITIHNPSSAGQGGTLTVCKEEPINLFDALSGNVDFGGNWYDSSGNLLTNSQPSAPNTGGSFNFTYVTSDAICTPDTAVVEVIVNGDCSYWSVEEEAFTDITIYPNPTSDVLNIVNPSNAASLNIQITDMNGRVVLDDSKVLNNVSKGTLNITALESGVYTLSIYNEVGRKTFKIIKQ